MYAFPYVPKEEEGKLNTSCQAFNHKAKMHAWNIMKFVSKKTTPKSKSDYKSVIP